MRGLEIAFAGRSNVGKSSLINALTGRNALARTSHTPGRTQELIFFHGPVPRPSGDPLVLVDMPGYGYAEASKTKVKAWTTLIHAFLAGRANLARVYLLIDGRHGLKPVDDGVLTTLDKAAVNYQIVLDQDRPGEAARPRGAHRGDQRRAQEASGRVPGRARDIVAHRRRHAGVARGDRAAVRGAREFLTRARASARRRAATPGGRLPSRAPALRGSAEYRG